jgi:hypothetical protein
MGNAIGRSRRVGKLLLPHLRQQIAIGLKNLGYTLRIPNGGLGASGHSRIIT